MKVKACFLSDTCYSQLLDATSQPRAGPFCHSARGQESSIKVLHLIYSLEIGGAEMDLVAKAKVLVEKYGYHIK